MKQDFHAHFFRVISWQLIALLGLFPIAVAAQGQYAKPAPAKATIPALLLSDIHFEPFWDPAKVPQLATAPVSQWKAILATSPSSDRQQRFQSLQQTCHTRGADTPFALFDSSLKAMRKPAAGASFVTVSGDLLAHAFDCKFNTLLPNSAPNDYRVFVEKTLDFVISELDAAFPGIPVYVALGNNDSDCGDYRLDAHSEFLSDAGKEVTRSFPATQRQKALETFAAGGFYSVSLPAPIQNARLLVLNDIFQSSNYATCAGKPDQTESAAQLAWLRQQLAGARANKQKIWVMGHIPPGVDLYSTVKRSGDLCGSQNPAMFLSSEELADALVDFSDVVQLAIFAHTHMDEMRILKNDSQSPASGKSVAAKMVPSISPINGNSPSFTVAEIDPSSAALKDYRVFAASNLTGINTQWKEEYDYARSFNETAFSSSSVNKLIAGFAADDSAKTPASQHYIEGFSAGSPSPVLLMFWPQYVCTLSNHTAQAFKACVCPAAH